jgi:uncharacterized glyoxalase superfamily protein PhnB
MRIHAVNPVLNVTSVTDSIAWFEKLGWTVGFTWEDPPSFGSVRTDGCTIFLCQDGQGSRGRSPLPGTFDDDTLDKGVWMTLWVDDVDQVHRLCVAQGIEVGMPPADMPWNVREMHVRHPDGHVFRFSKGTAEE